MALTLTREQVLEQVSLVSPFGTFGASTNPTLTEAYVFLEDACLMLSAKLHQQGDDDVLTYSGLLTTTASESDIDLSELDRDCLFVRKVEWVRSSTETVDLRKASVDEMKTRSVSGWQSCGPTYRVLRNSIRFYPTPNQVHTVSVHYGGNLSFSGGVTEDVRPGWKEWLTYEVCRRLEQRFGDVSKSSYWEAQRDAIWDGIIVPQMPRDDWGVETIRDLRDDVPWSDEPRRGGW